MGGRRVPGAASGLAEQGLAHGDLSARDVLVDPRGDSPRPVPIDLPQAVNLVANPLGAAHLRRDVRSITAWFAARGAGPEKSDPDGLHRLLSEVAHIR